METYMDGYNNPGQINPDAAPVMPPGIYSDIEHDSYLAKGGTSVSKLKTFAKAPAKARYGETIETNAHRLGTLWHCAVLEPDQFEKRYCPTHLDRRGTKAWDQAESRAMGRRLVKQEDFDEALYVRDAVLGNPAARAILTDHSAVEQSFFWEDPETGLACRGRADLIHAGWQIIGDIKTTQDASKEAFRHSLYDFRYHWQNAFYNDGYRLAGGFPPQGFIFVAIEKVKPYLTGVYELTPAAVQKGREDIRAQMVRLARCIREDYWPGYSDEIETIDLPAWAYNKES
jgi:hypothetical protein